jgi:integration host factor subunit alpha
LADAVHRVVGLSRQESGEWVETVLAEITKALAAGEQVKISSFGTWIVRVKQARQGRNPKTKAPATISERRVVVFRPSQILKKWVNFGNLGPQHKFKTKGGDE